MIEREKLEPKGQTEFSIPRAPLGAINIVLPELIRAEEHVGEGGGAEPVAHGVRAEEAAAEELARGDVRWLGLASRQQRGHDGLLTNLVFEQVAIIQHSKTSRNTRLACYL